MLLLARYARSAAIKSEKEKWYLKNGRKEYRKHRAVFN